MHIIIGGTGRVGSATARALLRQGEPVTVVTRNAGHAADLRDAGAKIAVADVRDVPALRAILRTGTTALLLNPPAAPFTDTDAVERANAAAIVDAVTGSGLRKAVAVSTFGARPGAPCGDLTVLFEFEEKLRAQAVPVAVNRGAYYMSNWAEMLDTVRHRGKLPSFFPQDVAIPMVAPDDLGEAAAGRLMDPADHAGIRYIEGPRRYTPRDVADAFARALDRPVDVEVIPRPAWEQTYRRLGFSPEAARSYACMTGTVLDEQDRWPDTPVRGPTTLDDFIRNVVRQRRGG
ncbi:NmrA family NAD(P)-binding protein [Massilia rhizosphaerae]|uniref:NmrA family NAD(P)-binding protein n=1 Tax=Massilia rhizosphaerae TaxID=2784389 RepID=UPI0018DEA7BB|nr:NmrA family NAD(P)-binding protein [Massilia rhizosphaerae]